MVVVQSKAKPGTIDSSRISPLKVNTRPAKVRNDDSHAYELQRSQVDTPVEVVKLVWRLVQQKRKHLQRVVDLGAGDGRFSLHGSYESYEGIEIDKGRIANEKLPSNAVYKYGCAFAKSENGYDACIGNPPYVRHHNIDKEWLKGVIKRFESKFGANFNQQCNLFVYFMWLAIEKTNKNGLIAFVIPYEWVSRPSSKGIRDYLEKKKWGVEVYRFEESMFDGVLTTASITIIDKKAVTDHWKFFNIKADNSIVLRKGISGTNKKILQHGERGEVWALRGLSPGTQEVFTLTEGERIHSGLSKNDVRPCVTTFRRLPPDIKVLDRKNFQKYYVDAGEKCWLILSNQPLSKALKKYLENIPESKRSTFTCISRSIWYDYPAHPVPKILYSSSFVTFGPKSCINEVGASAIGSIHGIHYSKKIDSHQLRSHISTIDFEKQVVAHAASLKKIEVKQMNTILNSFLEKT